METHIKNVVVTRDGGYDCWDTTISAREIARAFKNGLLEVDPTISAASTVSPAIT